MAEHTQGPWVAAMDMDGRHGHIAILTEAPQFMTDGEWPYHPKIVSVHCGKRTVPREIAEANARLICAAPKLLKSAQLAVKLINLVEKWAASEQQESYEIMDEIVGLCEFERGPHEAVAAAFGIKIKEE